MSFIDRRSERGLFFTPKMLALVLGMIDRTTHAVQPFDGREFYGRASELQRLIRSGYDAIDREVEELNKR